MIGERSYCPIGRRNTNKQKYEKIWIAGGAELMQETPITSKNLITEEGCPANQDLGNSQFDPSHKIHPRRLLYKPRHFEI